MRPTGDNNFVSSTVYGPKPTLLLIRQYKYIMQTHYVVDVTPCRLKYTKYVLCISIYSY